MPAASIHEFAMLLPSPIQAYFTERSARRTSPAPKRCATVCRSARTWQGCIRSVRPLMTGTLA